MSSNDAIFTIKCPYDICSKCNNRQFYNFCRLLTIYENSKDYKQYRANINRQRKKDKHKNRDINTFVNTFICNNCIKSRKKNEAISILASMNISY
jgi:hypothetical protein